MRGTILLPLLLTLAAVPAEAQAVESVVGMSAVSPWTPSWIGSESSPPAPPSVSLAQPRGDRFFAEDKLKHFFTSFAVTALSGAGGRLVGMDADRGMRFGVGVGAALGIGKEIHDLSRPEHTASLLDLIWDAGGVVAAAAVLSQVR